MAATERIIQLEQERNISTRRQCQRRDTQIKEDNSVGDTDKAPQDLDCDGVDGSTRNVEYELKKLSFKNPGKLMEDLSSVGAQTCRRPRKANRKVYKDRVSKNQLYDKTGVLVANKQDLCDCLDKNCPGCHFPCPKCGSEKCGTDCRCNRKWVFEYVHVEGTDILLKLPS